MQFMNLVQMMQKMDDIQMIKGEYFIGAMLFIYSVPFAWITF